MSKSIVEKKLVEVELPNKLFIDILYLNYLLRIKHASIIEETDDCIQTDYLCGGLWSKKKRLYGFTFYPNMEPDDFTWHFEITKNQIKQIANGKTDRIGLWKCKNTACNHYYAKEDDHCDFCNPKKV